MKKKIIAITLILIILMSNICVAAYERTGGSPLKDIAIDLANSYTPVDAKYNASSNPVVMADISVLNYGTTTTKSLEGKDTASTTAYDSTTDNWYLKKIKIGDDDYLFYTINTIGNSVEITNLASFKYKDGITYNGEKYDIRIDVEKINKTGSTDDTFEMAIGRKDHSDDTSKDFDFTTYTKPMNPSLGVGTNNSNNKSEVKLKYFAIDSTGTEKEISGVFGITDVDLNQGIAIGGYTVSNNNVFMRNKSISTIEYKSENSGNDTYVYSTIDTNLPDTDMADAFVLIDDKKPLDLTFTFDNKQAYSSILFGNDIVTRKYKVVFDPDGGTPTPTVQEVEPGGKATEPTGTDAPSKTGYTFGGWRKTNDTTNYDFDTTVTEDITLKAQWTPIEYTITYVLNATDATNDSRNPATYTVNDTIDFQSPIRPGYDFLGWYEDEALTTKKDGISHETGNKTVYAKWQEQTPQSTYTYKVEHYKETTDGHYELADSQTLSGAENASVTATPKTYTGYKENTTHESRVPTGTVKTDNSLVLKLYYDKEKYNVTFDTKGGTPTPGKQVVRYNDKATKPTTDPSKSGYEFQYWYYTDASGKEVQYSFDDPVTKDIELIAKWKEVKGTDDGDDDETPTPSRGSQVIPSTKTDTTVAQKIIPSTGKFTYFIVFSVIALATVFGVRYFYIRKIMK